MIDSLKQLGLQASGWFAQHETLAVVLAIVSVTLSVGGLLAIPWAIVRIPADYFAHERPPHFAFEDHHPVLRVVLLAIKNLLGLMLVIGGIVMSLPLVPGPGILSMLIGLMLLDVPGKRALERWIVRRPTVFKALNGWRAKRGKPPLEQPV